jgi:hypothetical protein
MQILLIVLAFFFQPFTAVWVRPNIARLDPPALAVVSARSEVMPEDVFSVTITSFGIDTPISFDAGDLVVISEETVGQTTYVTLRAAGPPRDVRIRAWAGDARGSAIVRVCCRVTDWPRVRVYLPAALKR